MGLDIFYEPKSDTLNIGSGQPASEGYDIAEFLIAEVKSDGELVGVTFECAREVLEPFLSVKSGERVAGTGRVAPRESSSIPDPLLLDYMLARGLDKLPMAESPKLRIDYDSQSDVLSLWNGSPASSRYEVTQGMVTEIGADGDAVGITLENARELLAPYFRAASSNRTESVVTILQDAD